MYKIGEVIKSSHAVHVREGHDIELRRVLDENLHDLSEDFSNSSKQLFFVVCLSFLGIC